MFSTAFHSSAGITKRFEAVFFLIICLDKGCPASGGSLLLFPCLFLIESACLDREDDIWRHFLVSSEV